MKIEEGDTVKCKEHGTIFVISGMRALNNIDDTIDLCYNNYPGNPCDGKYHRGWLGIPVDMLELISKGEESNLKDEKQEEIDELKKEIERLRKLEVKK